MKLHYTEKGKGSPVLMVHGWMGSSKSLDNMATILSNSGYRVINVDLPGFGESPKPGLTYSMKDYVGLIEDLIKDLDLRRPDYIGHSFGGKIGLFLAASNPLAINKLVLIDASGIRPKKGLKQKLTYFGAKVGGVIMWIPPFLFVRPIIRWMYYKTVVRESDYLKAGSLRDTFKNVINEHINRKLEKIKNQTLIVWGRNDKMTPLYQGMELSKGIKNSRLEIIEGTGHNLPIIYPQIVAELIITFLN